MRIEWYVALRFLREGRTQTALIVSGVAVGVAVLVFLTALISGLQSSLVDKTLGSQAHIVVRPPDEAARALRRHDSTGDDGLRVLSIVERPAQRAQSIEEWPKVLRQLRRLPGVRAVSPLVSGSALAVRGTASRSVVLLGVEPTAFARVIPVERRLQRGAYRLSGTDALIGVELAQDLGVDVGDRLRVSTAAGRSQVLTIRGIFDLGNRDVNERWLLSSMRSAQTLHGSVGGVTMIELTVDDIFEAEPIAQRIERRTGLKAESWTARNSELLTALESQSASSNLIQVFVVISVAMGIASVLIVSVIQRARQIGILRAMGMARRTVLSVFLLQGLMMGIAGAALGSVLGSGLALAFMRFAVGPDGAPLFPIHLTAALFGTATLIAAATGTVAAVLPARRAAALDPVEAIRQ